ncbi:hypothetical protein ACOMA7_03045 [Apilactobacillus sp. 1-1-2]|uniref:hypothetical protein n=1 Tax=Apilactobacillus sp. 1-1-2 TaxID=3411035 RepID=UPI003B957D03
MNLMNLIKLLNSYGTLLTIFSSTILFFVGKKISFTQKMNHRKEIIDFFTGVIIKKGKHLYPEVTLKNVRMQNEKNYLSSATDNRFIFGKGFFEVKMELYEPGMESLYFIHESIDLNDKSNIAYILTVPYKNIKFCSCDPDDGLSLYVKRPLFRFPYKNAYTCIIEHGQLILTKNSKHNKKVTKRLRRFFAFKKY